MKVVKSNSKTQYNFCDTNELSFKERILAGAGNSFVSTKRDMSTDIREPGNSYIDNKKDMSKPEAKYDQQCLDNWEEIGIPRDEAKKKRYGCQVNSSGKPWDDAYDELDKETSKINRSKKSSSSEGVTELDGRKLRNERHVVRHSPTDPQFNAKSTLANSDKKTGTYNGQKFDTKCRDNYMKMGIDRFTAAQACIGKQG